MNENEVVYPSTETVLMFLAGLAAVVVLKRYKWVRWAMPWLVRSISDRTFNLKRPLLT